MGRVYHHEDRLFIMNESGGLLPATPSEAIVHVFGDGTPQIRISQDTTTQPFCVFMRQFLCELSRDKRKAVIAAVKGHVLDGRTTSRRWFTESTSGLYSCLCRAGANSHVLHPGWSVARFLSSTGSSSRYLATCIRDMGDIAYSYSTVKDRSIFLDALMDKSPGIPSSVQMLHECRAGLSDPAATKWFRALFSAKRDGVDKHRLLSGVVHSFADPAEGAMEAWRSVVKLILSQWLANEFHPELLCDSEFSDDIDHHIYSAYMDWLAHERDRRRDKSL